MPKCCSTPHRATNLEPSPEGGLVLGTYRRRGHYRRSKNGGRHWVAPHSVTRNGRDFNRGRRSAWTGANFTRRALPRPPGPGRAALPYSARWAQPNAKCPVCGALVYFWSNAHGSRVFFDEMGPPWPKHPCTDSRRTVATSPWAAPRPDTAAWAGIPRDFRQGLPLSASGFRSRYGSPAASAFTVAGVRWHQGWTVLTLKRLRWSRRKVTKIAQGQFSLPIGQFVFVEQDQMTFLDAAQLDVRQVRVHSP